MDLLTAHRAATRQFDNRVRLVRDAQWGNATPCPDWDVRRLVTHVVQGQRQAVGLLTDRATPTDEDGDLRAAWAAAASAAADAWNAPGALERDRLPGAPGGGPDRARLGSGPGDRR